MLPGEIISLEYVDILGKNVLVCKDKATGHVMAELTPDKSTASVEKFLLKYFNHYGLPYKVVTDGSGCFRGRFQDFCKGLHIEPHLTSAYR